MPGGLEGPVNFSWSQSIAAGATFNPMTTFDYETPDRDVAVEVLHRATAVGLVAVIKSGGQAISQESPVQAGGTAGTLPARQTTEPMTGKGFQSRKLQVFYRNPTGGAITVDGIAIVTPIGGMARGGARRAPARRGPPRRRGRR